MYFIKTRFKGNKNGIVNSFYLWGTTEWLFFMFSEYTRKLSAVNGRVVIKITIPTINVIFVFIV
jgi:hypothetical protein